MSKSTVHQTGARVATTPSLPKPRYTVQEPIVVRIGYYALLVWTFLYFSRLLDISYSQLKIMMVLNVIWLAAAALSGGILTLLTTGIGLSFTAFLGWVVVAFPFSVWKGGSIETVQATLRAILLMATIMALVRTPSACKRLMYTIGFALTVAAVVSRISGEQTVTGRLVLTRGSFSDPNFFALALLLGLPFLLLSATVEKKFFVKLLSLGAVMPVLITAISTGSRSGFLALMAMFTVYFFRSSGRIRVNLLVGTAAAVVVVSLVASDYVVTRLTTIFGSSYDESLSAAENRALSGAAVASTNARKYLFLRSIELTIKNPIVGVGPGMFAVAEANDAQEKNMEEAWHETHNAYTQVSSEVGIPGLIFYLAGILLTFRSLSRMLKFRPAGVDDHEAYVIRQTAMHLQLSMVVIVTGAMFLSIAYGGLLFVLAGLAEALDRGAHRLLPPRTSASVPAGNFQRRPIPVRRFDQVINQTR